MKKFLSLLFIALNIWILVSAEPDLHRFLNLDGNKPDEANGQHLLNLLGSNKPTPVNEANTEYWINRAHEDIANRLKANANINKKAKNIIFFLGDGMSLTTVTAARIRKGQLKGNNGEEDALTFDKFPYVGLSKTYCANGQVPDSACTATAYLCGVKANVVTIGVSAAVEYNNCSMSMDPANHVSSIAAWAKKAGKSTGFVTTTTLTHASPAGMYAHTANRFWECDADVANGGQDPLTCIDMAQQLIKDKPGRDLDLMMGGGMGKFIPNTEVDAFGELGERQDGQNLLKLWQQNNPNGIIVTNRSQLSNLNLKEVDKVMGIFHSSTMDYHALADNEKQPRLVDMTEKAIEFACQNEQGCVIFIEGGRIDHGHHETKPGLSLDEALEMDEAILRALELTNPEETLIVVSADHGHPFSISGFPGRGTPILGLNQHNSDLHGVKYAILNYALGPEQYLDEHGQRLDLEGIVGGIDSTHPSQIPLFVGVHSGEDVGIFANGPQAHLFSGVMEQHTLPHLMAYAACIGEGPTMCDHNAERK